ncbi:MAG: diguanylate cyclase [Pseudomonadota bacterium]
MKALVCESTRLFQKVLKSLFESAGFEVTLCERGGEALERLKTDRFDLACIPMHFPDMEGVAMAATLRADPAWQNLPVLMITAHEDKKLLQSALNSGVTEVYLKSDLGRLEHYLYLLAHQLRTRGELRGKVLYVEDDPVLVEWGRMVFHDMGLEVDHYVCAEDAFSAFKEKPYDLVVSDFLLAGDINGLDLLRMIREQKGARGHVPVPVLVTTSLDDQSRKIELLRSGANDYINKPMVREEIQVRTHNLILNKQLFDQLERQRCTLEQLAMTDQLTSLYNRHYLFDSARKKLSEAARHNYAIALVVVDLDHFKKINDTHGHAVGDIVLRETGALLKRSVRTEDIAARFGGEEFVLLLSHCEPEGAQAKAERLRGAVEQLNPNGIRVTASIGVACFMPHQPRSYEELFTAADEAVYRAKGSGRNNVQMAV